MSTTNISLPNALRNFVETRVDVRGYGTNSEFVSELIRREQARVELREIVLEGMKSGPDDWPSNLIYPSCAPQHWLDFHTWFSTRRRLMPFASVVSCIAPETFQPLGMLPENGSTSTPIIYIM